MKLAEMVSQSSVCPKAYFNKPGDCLVAMALGAEVGLNPIQSLQNIAVINGKPSIYGDAAMALVRASGLLEDIKEEFDGNAATCTCKRRGQETPIVATFSMEDAKKAGLLGKSGPWSQYPARMLQMRARGFALRDGFADALAGLITAEEARDYPAAAGGVDAPKASLTEKLQLRLQAPDPNTDEVLVEVPADIQQAADHVARIDTLRGELEDIACEGMDRLKDKWTALSPRDKVALGGADELARLKRVAESAMAAPI